ncbi:MAG: hypothetical protein WC501_01210 [Candidatus Micrarchaeia archaeon]|jgi:hypothetical protein
MGILKSFSDFSRRVLKAVKGKLPASDEMLLEHLLVKTNQRNIILARGLLSAINTGSPKKEDIESLAKILDDANIRIMNKKEPFGEKENEKIAKIFSKCGLSRKVADWISIQKDIFLYSEINNMVKDEVENKKISPKIVKLEPKRQKTQKL